MMNGSEVTKIYLDKNVGQINVFCLFLLMLEYPDLKIFYLGRKCAFSTEFRVKLENGVFNQTQLRQIVNYWNHSEGHLEYDHWMSNLAGHAKHSVVVYQIDQTFVKLIKRAAQFSRQWIFE